MYHSEAVPKRGLVPSARDALPAVDDQSACPTDRSNATKAGLIQVVAAAVFATAFYVIPWWEILYGSMINEDIDNYLLHPVWAAVRIERMWDESLLSFLWREPVWLYANMVLYEGDLPYDLMVNVAQYVWWFGLGLFFLTRRRPGWFFWFICNPYFIDLAIIHARQGLATGLMLVGEVLGGRVRYAFYAAALGIHSSSGLILAVVVFVELVSRFSRSKVLPTLGVIVLVQGALAFASWYWAEASDNRLMYSGFRDDSKLYLVPWMCCALALLTDPREPEKFERPYAGIVAAVTVFAMSSAGGYRMVEGGFPFLMAATHSLSGWRRNAVFACLFTFQAVQFVYKYSFMHRG